MTSIDWKKRIMQVLFSVFIFFIIFCLFMLKRNHDVWLYRNHLINEMSIKSKQDINEARDWRWRHQMFNSITYNEMLYKFWKPMESFYNEKELLK